jgi:hypothetical protein
VNALRRAAAELFGLIVEDRAFAAAIAGWLGICGALAYVHAASAQTRALALFGGLAIVLIASVARAARVP